MTTDTASKEIHTEASRWADLLMDSDVTHAERDQFQRWLLAHELHQQEFRAHNMMLNLARDLPETTRSEMLSLAMQDAHQQGSRRKVWISALAASLVLAVGFAGWVAHRQKPATAYVTVSGMTSDVNLPDGSIAHLNTRTNLRWIGRSDERRVALVEGEVLFEVRHDAAKAFTVVLDASEIRVLGTHFNVRRRDNAEVVVTVLEGTVRVSDAASNNTRPTWTRTLHTNEQLVYNNTGVVRDVYSASRANAAKWREGILEFDDEPLSIIVEDFSRYTDRHIVIRDPRVAQLRLGGQLNVRDEPKAALGLLEKLAPVVAHDNGDMFVLDYR